MNAARIIVAALCMLPLASQAGVIDIGMYDSMRFAPAAVTVARGDTVVFIVRNEGKLRHEIVIGTPDEISHQRHAMQHDPGMAHAAPNMAHLAPGERGQLRWRADQPGQFEYACLLPGHYEAGMRGTIAVQAARITSDSGYE
jgi:uncharacterized cupredoxin-like copper-binding protein